MLEALDNGLCVFGHIANSGALVSKDVRRDVGIPLYGLKGLLAGDVLVELPDLRYDRVDMFLGLYEVLLILGLEEADLLIVCWLFGGFAVG